MHLNSPLESILPKKRLAGEILWVVAGQAASVLGAIIGVRLLTETLPPMIYGELALALTLVTLLNQTITGPLAVGFSRFFASAIEANEFREYFQAVVILTLIGSGLALTVGLVGIGCLLVCGYVKWVGLFQATLVFSLVSGCNSIMDSIQNAARHRSIVALHQGFGTCLRFLCAVWFVWLIGEASSVAMWGYCLSSFIVIGSQFWFFQRHIIHKSWNSSYSNSQAVSWRNTILGFAWPFALWGVLTCLQFSSDRWAIQVFCSTKEVGLYAVLYQLGYYPMLMLCGVLSQLLGPVLFQMAGDGTDDDRKARVSKRTRLITISGIGFSGCCFLGAFVFHDRIFHFLVAEEYRQVSWLLPAAALGGGLFGTAQLASLGFMSAHGSKILLGPKISTAIVGIALNFLLASIWGITGVISGMLLTSVFFLLWMLYLGEIKMVSPTLFKEPIELTSASGMTSPQN